MENIEQLKFTKEFPNVPYFKFWTFKENYLVQKKENFTLAINFSESIVEPFLYEYFPMLEKILQLSNKYINVDNGDEIHTLIKLSVKNRFILIRRDHNNKNDKIIVMGQFDNKETAFNVITNEYLPPKKIPEHDKRIYVIVDLKNIKPYFIQENMPNIIKKECDGTFYGGEFIKDFLKTNY